MWSRWSARSPIIRSEWWPPDTAGGWSTDGRWTARRSATYGSALLPPRLRRSRLANYVFLGITGTIVACARRRPDVILASSPPLPVGGVGSAVAARWRRPWVMDVRDLWPDAAVALGQVHEGPLLRAAQRFEHRLYRSAAAITVTTAALRSAGRGPAVAPARWPVISDGLHEGFLGPGDPLSKNVQALLGDRDDLFRWTYAGNLGMVAGLETADRCST